MAMLAFLRRTAQRSALASTAAASHSQTPVRQARRLTAAAPSQALSAASLFSTQTRAMSMAKPQLQHQYVANDVTGVLAGVAIVGALIGVGKMWWDASSSPSTPVSRGQRSTSGVVQDITRDDIAQFFVDLKAAIQQLFTQLPEIDEQFRKHLKSQNVELGEEEYKQTLLQQLFDVLQNIEQQVVGSRGWDQESFALAMEKYSDDEEIKQLQAELQAIMHNVFPPPELPEDLTPEKALEILAVLIKGMEKAMSEMLKHARAEGITDPTKAMEEFSQIYLDQVEQITFEEMKKAGIPNDIFNVALQKFHAESPEFRKKVEELYAHQAETFRRMGLDVQDK